MKSKLVFSTRTTGNGELAKSNRRFNKRVKSQVFLNKTEIAANKLDKMLGFNTKIN